MSLIVLSLKEGSKYINEFFIPPVFEKPFERTIIRGDSEFQIVTKIKDSAVSNKLVYTCKGITTHISFMAPVVKNFYVAENRYAIIDIGDNHIVIDTKNLKVQKFKGDIAFVHKNIVVSRYDGEEFILNLTTQIVLSCSVIWHKTYFLMYKSGLSGCIGVYIEPLKEEMYLYMRTKYHNFEELERIDKSCDYCLPYKGYEVKEIEIEFKDEIKKVSIFSDHEFINSQLENGKIPCIPIYTAAEYEKLISGDLSVEYIILLDYLGCGHLEIEISDFYIQEYCELIKLNSL